MAPEITTACHVDEGPEPRFDCYPNLGEYRNGRIRRLGGRRSVVTITMIMVMVGLRSEVSEDEETGERGGEEDEKKTERTHLLRMIRFRRA